MSSLYKLLDSCATALRPVAFDCEFVPNEDDRSNACGVLPVTLQLAGRNDAGILESHILYTHDDMRALRLWFMSPAPKLAHFAPADRHCMANLGVETRNVLDTFVMARFLFPTLENFGLKALHCMFCGSDPAEVMDWNKRFGKARADEMARGDHPRHAEFIQYALKDPVMTVELYEELLLEMGRR